MAAAPFKVKALFEYKSPHEDDLSFPAEQIITVTEEEDADWYIGEYTDASGGSHSGLFPKNFVERYEPAPPPRPNRAARPKPAEAAPVEAPAAAEPPPASSAPIQTEPEEEDAPAPPVASKPPPPQAEPQPEPPAAPKITPAEPAKVKSPPPPVAAKSSSFRDRIAAFNKPAAAPIAPFKPGGAPSTFIKKPFVAPPPSRDAYVPVAREAPVQKIYRREEDPEIAERQRQDQEDAEKAGLAPAEGQEEEQQPKAMSLKDRIAALQKQQMEQAQRRAGGSGHDEDEKPKRAPKPAPEVSEREPRDSIDTDREVPQSAEEEEALASPPVRKMPKAPEAPALEQELFSDGNEADRSAVDEPTDDAGDDDTSVEEAKPARAHPDAPAEQPEVGDEEDTTEGEEDEMDEEERRQIALRERMAKLSGGMGMPGMFNPLGGMPMPGIGGAAKKKPAAPERKQEEREVPAASAPRVPMVPIPGMGGMPRSEPAPRPQVIKEPEDEAPITSEHDPEDIPDVEDIKSSVPASASRAVPPPPSSQERPANLDGSSIRAPPPIPGGRPSTDAPRSMAPPPLPINDPSAGSESDDEMPETPVVEPVSLPIRGAAPPIPTRDAGRTSMEASREPRSPPRPPSRTPTSEVMPTRQPSEKRMSRAVPPIPMGSPGSARAPPPPPGRTATSESLKRRLPGLGISAESGSEYEGDYDTDIASGDGPKDALKAHARESSLEDGAAIDDIVDRPNRAPPPPAPTATPRAVPPLPPQAPPGRTSADISRPAPPPIPAGGSMDDDEYDPYRYSAPSAAAAAPAAKPPRPLSMAPPPPPQAPPAARGQQIEEESEPENDASEYSEEEDVSPPRMSSDRGPPPLPPMDRAAPPPPAAGPALTQVPTNTRRSTDIDRATMAAPVRQSMEQGRPSMDQGFIARDIDMAPASHWWMQPNAPPLALQNRNDVLFEVEESTSTKRGGKTTVTRDIYALFSDYSQTIINVQFDAKNADDVHFEQSHKPPPARLRQDQLEEMHSQFGARIAEDAAKASNNTVGDGTPNAFIASLLAHHPTALPPIGTRSYGALVYANLANATQQQHDEIRPGDIVTFRNAKFQGKHGAMHAKYSLDVGKPDHVGIVQEWDGTKKKIKAWEQGREKNKVKNESFRMGDLRSGEVRVWRVMPRSWVGWES